MYAYGYIFSFAQDVGFRYAQVSRHWLYETTKGKFGEYSATEQSIGQRFNFDTNQRYKFFKLEMVARFMNRFKESVIQNSKRLAEIASLDE